MPSGKRETERKVNAPVNTGPSPNSDERVNNPTEGADEPARAVNGLPPLGLNYIRIRAHCSFIGRCLRYFIRP
ncbi:hypothetical protein T09_5337 [Trichinella sp. T9]|nr:hypothetical protein T09_5337 [Trichinella sp. T9]